LSLACFFEPLTLLERLAALTPRPRINVVLLCPWPRDRPL